MGVLGEGGGELRFPEPLPCVKCTKLSLIFATSQQQKFYYSQLKNESKNLTTKEPGCKHRSFHSKVPPYTHSVCGKNANLK